MFGGRGLNVGSVEVSVSAKYSGNDLERLESDLRGADRAADSLGREMKQTGRESYALEKKTSRLGGTLKNGLKLGALAAGAALTTGLAMSFKKAVENAKDAERIARQTEAVLKSTGNTANISAQGIQNLASAIQKKTAVDDEATKSSSNLLLTFKNIQNSADGQSKLFNRSQMAIVDMAAAMTNSVPTAESLKTSTIQLGKALNDPIKGMSALSRVGIQFTEDQKKQITSLVETGKLQEAQKLILKEVESQFKGSAEAQATAMDHLRETWNDLLEIIGKKLLPIIENAAASLEVFVAQFMEGKGAGGEFRNTLEDIGEIAKNLWPTIKVIAGIIVDMVKAFASLPAPVQTALVSIGLFAGIAAKFGVLATVLTKVWAAAKTLFMMFRVAPMLMGPLGLALAGVVTAAVLIIKNWGWVKKTLGNVWGWMKTAFKNVADFVSDAAKKGFLGPTIWIIANWDKVKNMFRDLPSKIRGFLAGVGRIIAAPFTWAFDKIKSGVEQVKGWVEDIKNTIGGLPGKVGGIIGLSQGGKVPAYANGGRVGPTAGGPRMFLAGEGRKDEWVISQEGNRRRNVGYLVEAAKALGVTMFASGGVSPGSLSKGKKDKKESMTKKQRNKRMGKLEAQFTNLENKYSFADRRFGMDGKYTRGEVKSLVGIKSAMIKNLRQQQSVKRSRDRYWQIKQLQLDKKELWQRLRDQAQDSGGTAGSSLGEQISAFNAERFALLSSFGGNTRARSAGPSAAPQTMTGGGAGKTINITQNYQKPPEDPHAWTRKVQHEVGALV